MDRDFNRTNRNLKGWVMKNILRLTELNRQDIYTIFKIADDIQAGRYSNMLKGKTVVMFFSNNSIRTRVSFEKGINILGGQVILFPTDTLDKKEDIRDVCGYLNNWADVIIARHKDIKILDKMASYSTIPVINAMTDINHPCEILSDLYALSKIRKDFEKDKYLFCGAKGNIGLAWKEASDVLHFELTQCCKKGEEIAGLQTFHNIKEAILEKDIVCTDSIPNDWLAEVTNYQITKDVMQLANKGAILNPCPPFYRGKEVSEDVIESDYFVGYTFKRNLLYIQQAIILFLLLE